MELTMDDIDELLSYLRECIKVETKVLNTLTSEVIYYENVYIASKECLYKAMSKFVRRKPWLVRVSFSRLMKCVWQYKEHLDKNLLLKCINSWLGRF